MPLDAEQLPVLRARRHLERQAPVGRRDLDRRPERGLVEAHRQLEHEVVAAALEELRALDTGDHEEVARRRAAPAGLAFALQPDLRPVLHPGRDRDAVALRAPLAARAVAGRAGRVDDGADASTVRARLLEGEKPLRARDDTAAVAPRAGLRSGSGRRAGAVAGVAGELERHRHRHLQAAQRVVERHPHLDLDVGAALAAVRFGAAAPAAAEEAAEEVAEVEVGEVDVGGTRAAVAGAEGVVLLALVRLAQHVVGLLDLLELRLRRRVARIAVGVVLTRELAIRLLQLVGRGVLGDTERRVVGGRHDRGGREPTRPRRTRAGPR